MAITQRQLNDFKNDLLKGFEDIFGDDRKKVFDPDDPNKELHLSGDSNNRKKYFDALNKQNQNDKWDEIQRQIDELSGNTSKLAKLKREELKDEQERIRNGGISKKDEDKYKKQKLLETINKISGIINGIAQIANAVSDGILAHRVSQLKEGKNIFEKTQKIFQANMEMSNVVASNIITTITSFTTQLATDAAQSLTSGAKEEANARIKLFTSLYMAEQEFAVAEEQRKIEEEKAITNAAVSGTQGIANVVNMLGPVGMVIGGVVSAIAGAGQAVQDIRLKWKDFDVQKMEQYNTVYNEMMGRIQAVADKMKNITDGIDNAANDINNHIRESDTVYKHIGLTMGFSGDKFSSMMRDTAIKTAKIFGITAEEMKNMQENFISNSSRAIMLNGNNFNQMTAISRTFGISQNEVSGIMGGMNLFNISIDEGYNKFDKMYHTVTKMGLSTSKFAKDLNNNLKLAQKYNFKGGVENMMKMTQWAQQTRFNLNSATSFADSIVNGNLNDVLEKSAKLQVLGGSAAIYSDPLGMLYDAGADVGNLAQRMAGMFNDITGKFNKKTGETEFSWYENRMIATRAQALGMDPGEVKNMIRQNQKQGVINKELKGFGLSDEDKLAIGNRAQYTNGKWMVNTRNGEMSIQDLANLTKDQREEILLPENQEEAIMQIAENTRSMVENEKANLEYQKARVGKGVYSTAKAASDMNIESQNILYNSPEYIEEVKKSITATAEIAKTQAEKTKEFVEENGKAIAQYRTFVQNQIKDGFVFTEPERKQIAKLATEGIKGFSEIAQKVAEISIDDSIKGLEKMAKMYEIMNGIESGGTQSKYAGMTQQEIRKELEKELYESDEKYKKLKDFNGRMSNTQQVTWSNYSKQLNKKANEIYNNLNDGFGSTNGGMVLGASNVKSINDGAINVKTSIKDQFLAAATGGPIDILLKQILPGLQALLSGNDGSNELNVKLSGNIQLSQDGSSINLVDLIKTDPTAATKFMSILLRTSEVNKSGRSRKNHLIP